MVFLSPFDINFPSFVYIYSFILKFDGESLLHALSLSLELHIRVDNLYIDKKPVQKLFS